MNLLPKKTKKAALIAISLLGSISLSAAERPNIILVMADDQGYGDAGYTGHPFVKTPTMDAMAKEGLVFSQFYAGSAVCSPTRASVMTGRTPVRTNVHNHGHYLRPEEVTIAEALKSNGYKTAHFGKWHIGSVQKESPTSPGQCGFDEWLTALNFYDRDPYMSHNGQYKRIKGQGSVVTMSAAINFISKNAKQDQPLFTVIWFPSPHIPHREKSADPKLYAGKKNMGYYQEITLLDDQLGRLRKALRDLDIHENTLLWYCSDNGGLVEEFSGGRGKKGSVYEGGLRIPSLIEWPAKYQNKIITAPASTSDMYPTLLAITETTVEDQPLLDGVDLTPLMDGTSDKRKNMIGFWHKFAKGEVTESDKIISELMTAQKKGKPSPYPERLLKNVDQWPTLKPFNDQKFIGHSAMIDWPYKIHGIANASGNKVKYELYNLEEDPMETEDLSNSEKKKMVKMKQALSSWQSSVINSLNGNDYKKK